MTKDKPFDFWNDHSLEFLEMAMKRDYHENVQTCDGYGRTKRDCGDTIEFFLNRKNDLIDTISYDLKGCIFSHACVNTIILLALHKTIEEARHITAEGIILFLKTLPQNEAHCAVHALSAFRMALDGLENHVKKPV